MLQGKKIYTSAQLCELLPTLQPPTQEDEIFASREEMEVMGTSVVSKCSKLVCNRLYDSSKNQVYQIQPLRDRSNGYWIKKVVAKMRTNKEEEETNETPSSKPHKYFVCWHNRTGMSCWVQGNESNNPNFHRFQKSKALVTFKNVNPTLLNSKRLKRKAS
jgi:hypothetical protein